MLVNIEPTCLAKKCPWTFSQKLCGFVNMQFFLDDLFLTVPTPPHPPHPPPLTLMYRHQCCSPPPLTRKMQNLTSDFATLQDDPAKWEKHRTWVRAEDEKQTRRGPRGWEKNQSAALEGNCSGRRFHPGAHFVHSRRISGELTCCDMSRSGALPSAKAHMLDSAPGSVFSVT